MDEELKNYLTAMEDRLKAHVDERVERSANAITAATAAEIGALHMDIRQLEARVTAKIDEHGVRIDRHAALLQTGARQLMRTFQNQEELSRLWREVEERGREVEKRVFALERRPDSGNQPSQRG